MYWNNINAEWIIYYININVVLNVYHVLKEYEWRNKDTFIVY